MADRRIARIFIRKNTYTPTDDLCFFREPGLLVPEVDEVHISCLFTWDKPRAEWLARQWRRVAPVKIGGPAYPDVDSHGGFTPGLYVEHGYVFTSRGCVRKCPFCLVRQQEGCIRELSTIHVGNKLMDNNLLACSRPHIEKVFSMLDTQKDVMLMGGVDIRLLKKWQAERIGQLHLRDLAIAYDMEGLEEPLARSLDLLHEAGVPHGKIHCFVLVGFFDWDSPEKAEERCRFVLRHGATPTAMLYRTPDDMNYRKSPVWASWCLRWAWQRGVYAMAKREGIVTYQDLLNECNKSKDN